MTVPLPPGSLLGENEVKTVQDLPGHVIHCWARTTSESKGAITPSYRCARSCTSRRSRKIARPGRKATNWVAARAAPKRGVYATSGIVARYYLGDGMPTSWINGPMPIPAAGGGCCTSPVIPSTPLRRAAFARL